MATALPATGSASLAVRVETIGRYRRAVFDSIPVLIPPSVSSANVPLVGKIPGASCPCKHVANCFYDSQLKCRRSARIIKVISGYDLLISGGGKHSNYKVLRSRRKMLLHRMLKRWMRKQKILLRMG